MPKKVPWIVVGALVVTIVAVRIGVAVGKHATLQKQRTLLESAVSALSIDHDFSALHAYVPISDDGQDFSVFCITSYPAKPTTYLADVFALQRKFYEIRVSGEKVSIRPDTVLNSYLGSRARTIPTTADFTLISQEARKIQEKLPELQAFLLKNYNGNPVSIISLTSYPAQGSWRVKVKNSTSLSDITYAPATKTFSISIDSLNTATDYGEGE